MAYFPEYDGTERIVRLELCFTFYLILFNFDVFFSYNFKSKRHPWAQSYSKSTSSSWETNPNYCNEVYFKIVS